MVEVKNKTGELVVIGWEGSCGELQFLLKPIAAGDCLVQVQAAFHILAVNFGEDGVCCPQVRGNIAGKLKTYGHAL